MNISSEICSSDPSGRTDLNNFVEVIQQKIYLCGLASKVLLTLPHHNIPASMEMGYFYYKLITIHFLSANKSICTVLFKIQELLYEFVETKRVITKSYYPPCWLSPGF